MLGLALLAACGHVALTPEQQALKQGGDCEKLLLAADEARAASERPLAAELAKSCEQGKLADLVARSTPVQALLWCGRARAAVGPLGKPACDGKTLSVLKEALHPRITLGPPEPTEKPDPLLALALAKVGPETNLAYDADDPDVIIGRLQVNVEHQENPAFASAAAPTGKRRQVPATNHRVVARVEAQAEVVGQTRTLRAGEEARDVTWEAVPRFSIPAKGPPQVPPDEEMKLRAAVSWVRNLARVLAQSPPETVDTNDAPGCAAYGVALNVTTGDPLAAATGAGDPIKVDLCARLLGVVPGAGLPLP